MKSLDTFFSAGQGWAPLALRLVAGWRLIAGDYPYAFFQKPMSEVVEFFIKVGIPFPQVMSWISVYAQVICGLLFLLGWQVRAAAAVMVFNFTVAILAAHLSDPIDKSFAAWGLWAMSLCLLFLGAGRVSLDDFLKKNKA